MLAPLGVPVTGLPRTKGIVAWTGAKRLLILKGVIMTAGTQTDPDFAFAGLATPEAEATEAVKALAAGPDPLGALAGLLGTWKGHGFNAIWRPHHPASQHGVDRQYAVFGAFGAITFMALSGVVLDRLRAATPAAPSPQHGPPAATA